MCPQLEVDLGVGSRHPPSTTHILPSMGWEQGPAGLPRESQIRFDTKIFTLKTSLRHHFTCLCQMKDKDYPIELHNTVL